MRGLGTFQSGQWAVLAAPPKVRGFGRQRGGVGCNTVDMHACVHRSGGFLHVGNYCVGAVVYIKTDTPKDGGNERCTIAEKSDKGI